MHNTYDHTVFMIGVLESPTPVTIFHVSNKQIASGHPVHPPTRHVIKSCDSATPSDCPTAAFALHGGVFGMFSDCFYTYRYGGTL